MQMAAHSLELLPKIETQVEAVQNACLEHQKAISQGINDISERLARLRAVSQYVRSQSTNQARCTDLGPKVQAYVHPSMPADGSAQHAIPFAFAFEC